MIEPVQTLSPKSLLRKRLRRLRDSLPPEIIKKHSLRVNHHLIETVRDYDFKTVMIYFHIGSEVMTSTLMDALLDDGRHVLGPVITEGHQMEAYRVLDPSTDLIQGAFGIPTPDTGRCDLYSPRAIDCIVVPGLGFDRYGCRIGYGGGYYDRFLTRSSQAHTIGAAFQFQIVATTFPEIWDRTVNQVATDQELICSIGASKSLKQNVLVSDRI